MTVYHRSEMETFWPEQGSQRSPCEVRISDGTIAVSYDEDGQQILYSGFEIRPGHFELQCPPVNGTATLHQTNDDDDVLVGRWIEGGYRGLWTVQLTRAAR